MKFEINFGTLLPLGAMAIALASAWGNVTTSVSELEKKVTEAKTVSASYEARLRAVETGQSNMTARLDAISESLNELKAYQRETNTILRDMLRSKQ